MRQLLAAGAIFILGSAGSALNSIQPWIVKASNSSSILQISKQGCTHQLLNPNLGADIYEVSCLGKSSFTDFEKNRIWKIFLHSKKIEPIAVDPMLSDQWALNIINIQSFWKNFSTGDQQVRVAIIDTGLNYLHEDIQSNLAVNTDEIPKNGLDDDGNGYIDDYYGWDAANSSDDPMTTLVHGSHIAGVIGATSNNGIGISGMNWNVSIIPIKFVDSSGGGSTASVIRAIDYAIVRGAKIINMSWGGTGRSPLLEEMIERCRLKGVLFIAAAGNESRDNDLIPTYPASYPLDNMISVASINLRQELSWFSNWGQKSVHIAAPGESILSTISLNRYVYMDGTSMAVPHITGAAALIWSAYPKLSYLEVKNYILQHCAIDPVRNISVMCKGYFSF